MDTCTCTAESLRCSPETITTILIEELNQVKNLPAMQETRVRSLGRKDPLEKEMATYSSTLAWEIPRTEEPGRLQSMGSQELDTTQQLNHHIAIQNKNFRGELPQGVTPNFLQSFHEPGKIMLYFCGLLIKLILQHSLDHPDSSTPQSLTSLCLLSEAGLLHSTSPLPSNCFLGQISLLFSMCRQHVT